MKGRYDLHAKDVTNMEMRTFHCDLAYKVQQEHRSRCPCCAKPMIRAAHRRGKNDARRDVRTVGHDQPVGFGGDHTSWVYICSACNKDQGARTFRVWSRALARIGDDRADAVAALADIFDQHYRSNAHAKRLSASADAAE